MTQVFLSYSRKDLTFVKKLAADLEKAGLDVWYDISELQGGTHWQEEIENAIRASHYVIAVLSPASVASKWVKEELLCASELGKKIIPLIHKPCATPFGYRTIQHINIQGKYYQQNFKEILRALDVKPGDIPTEPVSQPIPPEPPEPKVSILERLEPYLKRLNELFKAYGKVFLISASSLAILALLGYISYSHLINPPLLFLCTSSGASQICEYKNNEAKVIAPVDGAINWLPVRNMFGEIYYTSNRDGKAEIYRIKSNGEDEQFTHTPDPYKSWNPVIGVGGMIYFTTNRDGKAEIYRLKRNGEPERVTHTPDPYESWSPVKGLDGRMYFTSNRPGKAEIYRLQSDGTPERMTNTPDPYVSWSPAVGYGGAIYFTSNRDGMVEIYHLTRDGEIENATDTPGLPTSWSPVIRGGNIYFTSNRSDRKEVYLLRRQPVSLSDMESWTNINEKTPLY